MRYISTRGNAEPLPFRDVLLTGLAPDGGLYVPETYPQLDLHGLRHADYIHRAFVIMNAFAPDIPAADLMNILTAAYSKDTFGERNPAPTKELEPGLHLLRLSNGPTLAFKDLALQLVARLMEYVLVRARRKLNVLAATSGDTGSAAEYAFRGMRNVNVFMLSPKGRMSPFQQRQMYTLDEPNIHNLVLDGTFDDCQDTVKAVNGDATFKEWFNIGAVNSINWARIAAQVVYWVHAYFQVTRSDAEDVMFSVPSGNFGNAYSAYVAMQMGLPVRQIIVATNQNDVLPEFFLTGVYRVRKGGEVKATSSPSMDIASASNFERLAFDLTGREPELVSDWWAELAKTGAFDGGVLMANLTSGMKAGVANEREVLDTIRLIDKYGVVIDPHTAVGMKVGLDYRKLNVPLVVAETAQPAKFPDTIRAALGREPEVPPQYKELLNLPLHTVPVGPYPDSVEEVKNFIRSHV
jgi:threonine synthase